MCGSANLFCILAILLRRESARVCIVSDDRFWLAYFSAPPTAALPLGIFPLRFRELKGIFCPQSMLPLVLRRDNSAAAQSRKAESSIALLVVIGPIDNPC